MALLGEPYLVTTYATPSRSTLNISESSKRSNLWSVYTTCGGGAHGEDYVTLTVQGDGIHVLNLATMNPIVSRTLGPSVFFAAPAVTRFKGPKTSTVYAAIHSDGTKRLDTGQHVWMWKEDISQHSEGRPEPRKSVVFPRPVEALWVHPTVPSHLIAVSTSGDIMSMSEETQAVNWERPRKALEVAKADANSTRSFMFVAEECLFLPQRWKAIKGVAVVCFTQTMKHLQLQVKVVHPLGEVETAIEHKMGHIKNIADISCDLSGVISVLSSTGEWEQFSFDSHGLNHTKTLHISLPLDNDKKYISIQPSILSMGSSFILMAMFEKASSWDVILLVWDVQYAVVITSHKVSLPSNLALNADSLPIIELIPSTSQVLLSVSPSVGAASRDRTTDVAPSRSAVFIVPIKMPASSNIALAMGKSFSTHKWLRPAHTPTWEDAGRRQVLHAVEVAQEKELPDNADLCFFTWVDTELSRLGTTQRSKTASSEGEVGAPPNKSKSAHKPKVLKPHLPRQFVSDIMNSVLQPSKQTDTPYSSRIVQYMISNKAVSHDMVEGGLIPALRRRRDWDSICLALRFVADLPESQIIQLLGDIIQRHRSGSDVMVVDSDMPTPVDFLPLLVSYQMSASAACLALKTCLLDVRDLTSILNILNGWLLQWNESGSDLVGCTDETTEDTSILPRLESIMTFLQILLDAHFLTLLHHPPAIELIQQLSRHLNRQSGTIDDLGRLHGALEAFVGVHTLRTHSRVTKESTARRKRKKTIETTELSIGMYQLEELTL